MQRRQLGPSLSVSAIGLGAMGFSGMYGAADDAESEATIRRALDLGITLIDTADFYGSGHNEMLIGRAIRDRRDDVVLSVKFGALRTPSGGWGPIDGRRGSVANFAAYSLRRLGVEAIDLYTPARIDPQIPIEETVGAMASLVRQGYVRAIGLSEVSPEQVRRAHRTHPIAAVQIEYSLWSRDIEAELLPTLRELGIGLVAYSPLSRGFLTGTIRTPDDFAKDDFRRHAPRFAGGNFEKNLVLADRVREIARGRGVTAAQLALAWVLSRDENTVAIVGTRKTARIEENAAADAITLSADDLKRLDEAIPPGAAHGERYAAAQMSLVYRAPAQGGEQPATM